MSNAVVAGCFNDSFTPQATNEAGESTAQDSAQSGGTRQPYYEAEFTFASFTGGLQPGLNVQVNPDRGDGSRMSYVKMEHTATDLALVLLRRTGRRSAQHAHAVLPMCELRVHTAGHVRPDRAPHGADHHAVRRRAWQ